MEVTTRHDGLVVINDAYNANPESMRAALRSLVDLAGGRRRTWAVLGPMGELGDAAAEEHAELGTLAAALGIERVLAVADGAEPLAAAAEAGGVRVDRVTGVDEAIRLLGGNPLGAGDVVLVKASRSFGLERVARALVETGETGGAGKTADAVEKDDSGPKGSVGGKEVAQAADPTP
jgi:UDP-N-acetylmuramoyl-tripeptide--D-alanyl-D-alanine ligase